MCLARGLWDRGDTSLPEPGQCDLWRCRAVFFGDLTQCGVREHLAAGERRVRHQFDVCLRGVCRQVILWEKRVNLDLVGEHRCVEHRTGLFDVAGFEVRDTESPG